MNLRACVLGELLGPAVFAWWSSVDGSGDQALCSWAKLLVGIAESCAGPWPIHCEAFRA